MSYLVTTRANGRLDAKEEPGAILSIGRGPQSHLQLDHATVDLGHARIEDDNGRYILTDLGSVTGTYVDGRRIERAQLADGDEITIGPFQLKARMSEKPGVLALEVGQIASSAEHKRSPGESRTTDYAAAYELGGILFNKTLLTWLLTAGGIILVTGILFAGKTRFFRPGAVADAHSFFANDCFRCHTAWHGPSEKACQECHNGPAHHAAQAFTPGCVSCHSEHRGTRRLAVVDSPNCVQCHGALQTDGAHPPSNFEKKITDFSRDHPEFAVAVANGGGAKRVRLSEPGVRQSDFARIKLNHELHLKPGLKSPKGSVQLACRNCHAPAVDGKLMAPINYEAHCAECHELGFDDQFPRRQAPHESPELVRAYLLRVYAELQDEALRYPEAARNFPLSSAPEKLNPAILQKVRKAESHLYEITCKTCHSLERSGGALPEIEAPRIPAVWLPHSSFTHKPHRMMDCASCHGEVSRSRETADVLLPGIATCRNCHREPSRDDAQAQQASAPTFCAACHAYHDKSKERDWTGRLDAKLFKPGKNPDGAR